MKSLSFALSLSFCFFGFSSLFGNTLLFHEPFENTSGISQNGGNPINGWVKIVGGVVGNAADFSGSKAVSFPISNRLNLNAGTIDFLVKMPSANGLGFFDIGKVSESHSWGIFKNRDHIVVEMKVSNDLFPQAWTIKPISVDDEWHLISVAWQKEGSTISYKVGFDGNWKTNFDGILDGFSPNLNGNFTVGWCGFYGYSESKIDEFRIFDYVKNQWEITQDYERYFPGRSRPKIQLSGSPTVVIGVNESYQEYGAVAYDAIGNDLSGNIVIKGGVDSTKEGSNRISYNVVDSNGGWAREVTRIVFVVDKSDTPVSRGFEYLSTQMDQYHRSFDIYTDNGSGGNHSAPDNWMGSQELLQLNTQWDVNCANGLTCVKNIWETTNPGWVGIGWTHPGGNWGDSPNLGYDLSGATKLTFKARGEVGGERVKFFAGGITGEYPDSIVPEASTGYIFLTNEWKEYSIDLQEHDLSHVISPFGWTVKNDPIFFIDDISIDLPRLDDLRFIQSYEPWDYENDFALLNTSHLYDNALALLAYMARGRTDDLRRAKILADTVVYALNNDRYYTDGRLRNAYASGDIRNPIDGTAKLPGSWSLETESWQEDEFSVSTHTGNMAWSILALLSSYERFGDRVYLNAAIRIGEWVQRETYDPRGSGGYTGGYNGWESDSVNLPTKLLYKSTEHNLDLYPAFMRLYQLTGNAVWVTRAEHAKSFVVSMWNHSSGHFWTGTTTDGITVNSRNVPLDIQAWAVMALPNPETFKLGVRWAENNCRVISGGYDGFDFNNDLDGQWWEGTAQMAVAYQILGELQASDHFIWQVRTAQMNSTNSDGKGIVSASKDGLTTGFDWEYFSRRHIGATAWFLFSELKYNPYWNRKTR